jgi:hypothetical protein|tara:strand:+ start:5317 stop:6003 length:687 start_codon:yes stop_codon:yes gene_type:complete
MKNKIYILSILIAIGTNAHGQTEAIEGKSTFGIYGGVNLQNINGKDANGDKLSNSLVIGYNIGVNYEFPIATDFYLQPGIQFIKKGTKGPVTYANSGNYTIDREIKLNYIEVPINFIFKPILGTGHLILGFGPYVGYAVGGKALFEGTNAPDDTNIDFRSTVSNTDPNNLIYFKRMDVGGNFFVGYELKSGLNFSLTSQLGLVNINSKTTSKLANQNTGFGLAIGYRF